MASTQPTSPTADAECVPDYDLLVTEDGKPVDGVYSEKQMRLLTQVLYTSWPGPGDGRPFLAQANVGLFFAVEQPPVVPDVLLSLDVRTGNPHIKAYRSYFVWVHGKSPDAAIEIVSNKEGDELGGKLQLYAKIGVPYYIVWDPQLLISKQRLSCFVRKGCNYQSSGPWFPDIGLGVIEWQGVHEERGGRWLRWCNDNSQVLPTEAESADPCEFLPCGNFSAS